MFSPLPDWTTGSFASFATERHHSPPLLFLQLLLRGGQLHMPKRVLELIKDTGKGGLMTELEYRIGVTFVYSDGRRETITVFRRGSDEESSRHDVWHEYKNRFCSASDVCLITTLLGINLQYQNTSTDDLNWKNPQPQFREVPTMQQGAGTRLSPKNSHL